jgi:hypothetical protein
VHGIIAPATQMLLAEYEIDDGVEQAFKTPN